jgi:thymidine phosphorylase
VEPRLREVTMALAVELFSVAEQTNGKRRPNPAAVREMLEEKLSSGMAYSKFLEIVSLQGGDTGAVDHGLPLAPKKVPFVAAKRGYLRAFNAEQIGMALVELGGGRKKTSDSIDPGVGFWFEKCLGDSVKKGDTIATIYARDAKTAEIARDMLAEAVEIGAEAPTKPNLIRQRF